MAMTVILYLFCGSFAFILFFPNRTDFFSALTTTASYPSLTSCCWNRWSSCHVLLLLHLQSQLMDLRRVFLGRLSRLIPSSGLSLVHAAAAGVTFKFERENTRIRPLNVRR